MSNRTALLALILAGGIFWYAQANAITIYADGSAELPTDAENPDPSVDPSEDLGPGDDSTPYIDPSDPDMSRDAFKYMLRCCEHNAADVASDMCYQTFYGGARFFDMSNHPVLTGELKGVPLPSQVCINAGIASGNCVSTAAGGYQITVPTWQGVRGQLPDFSVESQDAAADALLTRCGAYAKLDAGDFNGAIVAAGKLWASLPGAIAKQGQRSLEFAVKSYNDYMTGVV